MILVTTGHRRIDLGLLMLRLAVGGLFIAHGVQKVFVLGFPAVSGMFGHMGIPVPGVTGPFIALLELVAGSALVLGLFTRLASFGLFCDMVGAIAFVHYKNGFFLPTGYEFALLLAGVTLALVVTGAGGFSIDALLFGRQRAVVAEPVTVHRAA